MPLRVLQLLLGKINGLALELMRLLLPSMKNKFFPIINRCSTGSQRHKIIHIF